MKKMILLKDLKFAGYYTNLKIILLNHENNFENSNWLREYQIFLRSVAHRF